MPKRMREECEFEPGIPSEKSVVVPETCAQHQFQFKFRKSSNLGENLALADPEANPMVTQELIPSTHRTNPSEVKIDPNSTADYEPEAINSPSEAEANQFLNSTSCRKRPEEG